LSAIATSTTHQPFPGSEGEDTSIHNKTVIPVPSGHLGCEKERLHIARAVRGKGSGGFAYFSPGKLFPAGPLQEYYFRVMSAAAACIAAAYLQFRLTPCLAGQ
jgi:hypothetical protein